MPPGGRATGPGGEPAAEGGRLTSSSEHSTPGLPGAWPRAGGPSSPPASASLGRGHWGDVPEASPGQEQFNVLFSPSRAVASPAPRLTPGSRK